MAETPSLRLYQRKTLDQVTTTPENIISVYTVEQHIWAEGKTPEEAGKNREQRAAETRTVEEFLIDPVRPFLMEFFGKLSAPYDPTRKGSPTGQGYWVQAEFGSGKSHLLSFIGALALGGKKEWDIVAKKEEAQGKGKRESLAFFYENGIARKAKETRGVLVVAANLVGKGSGIGITGQSRKMAEYIMDAVADQFYAENHESLPLYPDERLLERFVSQDIELYQNHLEKFLKDPGYFDEEQRESIESFLEAIQDPELDPAAKRDYGRRLWDFYTRYLKITPMIPVDPEDLMKDMVERLLQQGYAGLLLILDEVSLFMKSRSDELRAEDEKTLVVLSNRLAKVDELPVWLVCAAQQKIESKLPGVMNIFADERLKLVQLLSNPDSYYDIALKRVREVTDAAAVDQYFEDYKRSFSWPAANGKEQFARFFPFYPPALNVVREVSNHLTTIRSALYFLLESLKSQRKAKSNELITLWSIFNDVINYTEDPSGANKSITSIKTKFPEEWKAYEEGKRTIDEAITGPLKVYRSRCEKILKTLYLYHVANIAPKGLSAEEIMNCVMESKEPDSDLRDNKDHYEALLAKFDPDTTHIIKEDKFYRFNPKAGIMDFKQKFDKARAEAEQSKSARREAWQQLLEMEGWPVQASLMTLDLAAGSNSLFRNIHLGSQEDLTIKWHGRNIKGRVYMRDLLEHTAQSHYPLPSINSEETDLDFAVFISSTPVADKLDKLIQTRDDPRVIYWSPDNLTAAEESLLIDFAAYRSMVREFQGQDSDVSQKAIVWVQQHLQDQMGQIFRIIRDSYSRGRIAAKEHKKLAFECHGELSSILPPVAGVVLDTTYVSRDLEFDAPAPFDDTNAINVMNGIIKRKEFPRNVKPDKEVQASKNYGLTLGIVKRPAVDKLILDDCHYAKELMDWFEEKLADGSSSLPVTTVYKNFMGIGGPGGVNYGLSRRLVQLYMLCLAGTGRIRITLSGKNKPADYIDYTNIGGIDFRVAVLDSFDQVQRIKPPEGWETIARFAAVLLEDEPIQAIAEDAAIQSAVQRLIAFKESARQKFNEIFMDIKTLFEELNTAESDELKRLEGWTIFFESPVEPLDAISNFRAALEKAFRYPILQSDEVRTEDVDDLKLRVAERHQAEEFHACLQQIRSAERYARVDLPEEGSLMDLRKGQAVLPAGLKKIGKYLINSAKMQNEFLSPFNEFRESYKVRYMQAFDQVDAGVEGIREQMRSLKVSAGFGIIQTLGAVGALGADPAPALLEELDAAVKSAGLFQSDATRHAVERDLALMPQPAGCPLTLANAEGWLPAAREELKKCQARVDEVLTARVKILLNPAIRQRLEQGSGEKMIADLLKAKKPEDIQAALEKVVNDGKSVELTRLLEKYLKRITIIKIRLSDFHPARRMVEKSDVDQLAGEFKTFIEDNFKESGKDETTIVEIE